MELHVYIYLLGGAGAGGGFWARAVSVMVGWGVGEGVGVSGSKVIDCSSVRVLVSWVGLLQLPSTKITIRPSICKG